MRDFLAYSAQASRSTDPTPWRTRLASIPKQLAFFDDTSARVTAVCTRRAGKTVVDSAKAVDAVVKHPRRIALYITLTSQTSRDNLEPELDAANSSYALGLRKNADGHGLRYYTREGGCVWLAGCKDKREAEKFRGLPYSTVIIDEGGTHRKEVLKYLIDACVGPALTDIGGQLALTGTPGEVPQGMFWAASTGLDPTTAGNWSKHRWSVRDNPHHPFGRDPAALEAYRLERGLALDDPTWLREFEGQWVLDLDSLIYHYDASKHAWDGVLPEGRQTNILGVDLGYDDECAFSATTSIEGQPTVYIRETYGKSQLLVGGIAAEIHRLTQRYRFDSIWIDSGGLGKTILKTLQSEYGLNVRAAEKQDKGVHIRNMKSAMSAGHLKVAREAMGVVEEWETLPWNEQRTNHAEGYPDHQTDATLYAHRQHPTHEQWVKEPPLPGTPAFAAAEMDRIRNEVLRKSQERARKRR